MKQSCNMIPPTNLIRQALIVVTQHPLLDSVISIMIAVHCLMYTSYVFRPHSQSTSNLVFKVFNVIYALEVVSKIIATGFLFQRGTFLRNLYNCIDLLCVVSFLLSLKAYPWMANLEVLKLYRTTQLLRRVFRLDALSLLLQVINQSYEYTVTILCFLFFILTMLSILGQTFF